MMHQGLDLSKFKKVSGDSKTSTLRHAKGHEIKIAHGSISPKMREQLASLPVYMAEGGEAEAMDDDTEDAPEEPAPEAGDSEEGAPEPEAPAEEAPAAAPPQPGAPPMAPSAADPEANTVVVQGTRRPPVTAQELDNEDALYAQDLQRGHIKPETMESLYGKRDTLGKIGTLFGLLVSGMGSGLTGQPNAVLEMMNNQIKNDMEAQKLSNDNAQNWLRLSQAHERQKAEIGKIGAETGLTRAHTGKVGAETEVEKKRGEGLDQDNYLKAINAAEAKAKLGALYHAMGIRDKLPDGPTKVNATNAINNTLAPAIMSDIKQGNARTAAQLNAREAIRGAAEKPQAQANNQGVVDTSKIQQLEYKGAQNAALGITGLTGARDAMTPAQAAAAREEAAMVNKNRLMYNTWKKTFEYLDKKAFAGKLNEQDYKAAVSPLIAQMTQVMPQKEAEDMGQSMFPNWKDWGGARDTKIKQTVDHFKTMESKTSNLEPFGLKPPFPPPPEVAKKSASKTTQDKKTNGPKEGSTGVANGKPVIYRNGKWSYK